MTLKLLRTIRLDPSDTFVFAHAAEPGEWAVTGSFIFFDRDVASLAPKERAAFRAGFAGVTSLGHSTLVAVTQATAEDRAEAIAQLAGHIQVGFGAPSREAATAAAREEVDFAASLCTEHPPGTLVAMHRTMENGEMREAFRTLAARDRANPGADRLHAYSKAFIVVQTDVEEEEVDLLALMRSGRS